MARKDEIKNFVQSVGRVRRKDVAEEFGLNSKYAGKLLAEMADEPEGSDRQLKRVKQGVYDIPERVNATDSNSDQGGLQPKLSGDTVRVPLLTMQIEGGTGEPTWEEEVEGYLHYDRNQIRRETGADPEQIAYLPVSGTSMQPTLNPGDRALVVRYNGEPLQDGSIYVFRNQRRGTIVKRVWWEDSQTVRLESDNDDGPTIKIDYKKDGDEWSVLGRVLRVEKHL